MDKKNPKDLTELNELVRFQIYGAFHGIGPFPYGDSALKDALDMQPMSELQAGIAAELRRVLRRFCHKQRLADGLIREVSITADDLSALEHKGLITYVSRLLLSCVKDDPRANRLRPDIAAWTNRTMVKSLLEFADAAPPSSAFPSSRDLRDWAEGARRSAEHFERQRPRIRGGYPTKLPSRAVLLVEQAKLVEWLRPRWKTIRKARQRGLWIKDVRSFLQGKLNTGSVKPDALRSALWPKQRPTRPESTANEILAAMYGVTRDTIGRATKPPKENR